MKTLTTIALFTLAAVGAPRLVRAGDTGARVGGTIEESAKTGGHAVRDGALTFGRTTRDFFTGGTAKAKKTWRANAGHTKEDARAGGRATRKAAEGAPAKTPEAKVSP